MRRTGLKTSLFLLMVCLTASVLAQGGPTIYLIGDSTMADKEDPDQNPEHGWGQVLPGLLKDSIKVSNHAVNGRSSKSFIAEGRWKTVLGALEPGDYVWIQFGHNDQKIKDSTRFTSPFTQYRYNLERYVRETREKGAFPVLMSSIVRRNFNDRGVLEDTHGNYPLVVRMVAKDLDVPFVDMQFLTERLEKQFGPEASKKLHLHFEPSEVAYYPNGKHDDTHLSKMGATLIASLALQEMARQDLGIKGYIRSHILQQDIVKLQD